MRKKAGKAKTIVQPKKKRFFLTLSKKASCWAGRPMTFGLAFLIILVWGVSGPFFNYSNTWQLIINTGTTIITFLMVFLIQNTQNRDTEAMQLKLDELIRATQGAHTVLRDLEELDEEELDALRDQYEKIAEDGRNRLRVGKSDTHVPKVIMQS